MPIIELKNISKQYQNAGLTSLREVLIHVSLTIEQGDSISVLGPSGSGKSTLLNIMGTLDIPTSGTAWFMGKNTAELGENELAAIRNQQIGFVFQLHHLLPQFTLIENVLLPLLPEKDKGIRLKSRQKALELIDWVGLSDKLNQRPGQLSVGECQRAAVVRALIREPKVLLADEPTGSLDQESSERMGKLLLKINREQQVTLVLVTHSPELAAKTNTIYRIVNENLLKMD